MRLALVQGTRPEIIKNYSIVGALRRRRVPHLVCHTNQHDTAEMRDSIYASMGYQPDRLMSGRGRIGATIDWLQSLFVSEGITHVMVNGDTAASLAGAIAAMYLGIPVSHVEAGLRADDPYMLEERNRIMVDSVAALLFAYTRREVELLEATPSIRGRVFLEGNTTVDLVEDFGHELKRPEGPDRYVFLTLHRRELTDDPRRFADLLETLSELADSLLPVVFPVHPRTADAMRRHGLASRLSSRVHLLPPAPVFDSLSLQKHSALVATDSGCVQEEAYILGKQCLTLRQTTERHLTVAHDANVVTGFDRRTILAAAEDRLRRPPDTNWPEIYGSPGAGDRIVARLLNQLHRQNCSVADG